jgi:ABC-type transport system involved in multi-copper enzyme maturation permease subunit
MTALAPSLPAPRLARAELLKLRRRRGLAVTVVLMTVGATVITYLILAILHAANPAHHDPAGGVTNLSHVLWLLSGLGAAAAVLAGTTAGAGDLSAGVFRELVVTGRSRIALFLARIPGGLAFLLSCVAAAYMLAAVVSVALAGSVGARAPSTGSLVAGGLWILLTTTVYFLLALGLSSLLGSRTTTIVVLLAWRLAVMPILLSLKALGGGRVVFPDAGIQQLAPHAFASNLQIGKFGMSPSAAILVLVLWTGAALALGAWRTATRDA